MPFEFHVLYGSCNTWNFIELTYKSKGIEPGKGQLISKGNFGVFNSSKNKLENFIFCPSLLGQKYFVRNLEELKKPKVLSKLTDL